MVDGAAKVSEDPFDEIPVYVARSMHVQARLIDAIGDVRARERQVLKRPGDAAIERAVRRRFTFRCRQLWRSFDRS